MASYLHAFEKKRQQSSRKTQEFVTIFVGESLEKFVIHKNLITFNSRYFATAFSTSFEEGLTQSMVLRDVDTSIFRIFAHWLYFQALPNFQEDEKEKPSLLSWAKLWMFARRILVSPLQDLAIQKIFLALTSKDIPLGLLDYGLYLEYVYTTLMDESLELRRIAPELFCFHQAHLADRLDIFPPAFSSDIVRAVLRKRGDLSPLSWINFITLRSAVMV